ncbi:MAG TPA: hypothetical protein DCQ64_01340 [Candidatus Rokubacteria bacterium]|nr:hypothetical protein [Candidatus Rokubacteria bacterium]
MADATTDLVLKVGSITSTSLSDINGDSATPQNRPGTLSIIVDAFGPRILQYVQNKSGSAVAMGELLSKPANVSVSNITAGSTTQATTSGLTADAHDGKLCYVLDNADSAGAAPEGEVSIVRNNTATLIDVERDRPFSVALAVNDDLVLISNWQAEDAADGDLAVDVLGVVLGNQGFADTNYGWVQREGYVVADLEAATGLTAGDPVVADAARIGDFDTDGQELWVGYALATVTSDIVPDVAPVNLRLFTAAGPGTGP